MDTQTLLETAHQRTQDLLQLAEIHFGSAIPLAEIRFDLRGKAAGMVVFPPYKKPYIRYNAMLLQENQEDFLTQTLPHEVAHLVARTLYGNSIRPHGDEWKSVMEFFAVDAVRCHSYDTHGHLARRLRRFTYACGCRQHHLTSIRHNRIKKGQNYHCKRCSEVLRPVK